MKQQFRAYLALRCQEQDLRTWFDPLGLSFDEKALCVTVVFPHAFFGAWFASGPQTIFMQAVQEFFGQHCRVQYKNTQQTQNTYFPKISLTLPAFLASVTPNTETNTKTSQIGHHEQKRPMVHNEATFDSFIVNQSNTFSLKTAKEAVRDALKTKQSRRYNPVIFCGASGSGKSHLLNAMAHELAQAMGPASVYCVSLADLETLVRTDKLALRKNLMQREAFFLDDMHLLCTMPHLHDEIVYLFDFFFEHHKQMAFACQNLAFVHDINSALRSRLELGLVLQLNEPDVEIRTRFVQEQCAYMDLKLSREQGVRIAKQCSSFRSISGTLAKISATVGMRNNIDDRVLETLLRHGEHSHERTLSHHHIIDIVSEHFNLSPEDILGNKRHKDVVFARHIAMFLCRELLGCSFPTLGYFFNGKDHSTTMYSVKKIFKLQQDNKDMHKLVTELTKRCLKYDSNRY